MQPSSLTFTEQVLLEVARFVGYGGLIGAIVGWLTTRHKTRAETHATDAGAAKTYAEAQRQYSEIINDAYKLIDDLGETCSSQRTQLRDVTMQRDKQIIEIALLEDEVKWLAAVMQVANVQLSDYDYLRRKRDDSPSTPP